jgi:hypothetical protein
LEKSGRPHKTSEWLTEQSTGRSKRTQIWMALVFLGYKCQLKKHTVNRDFLIQKPIKIVCQHLKYVTQQKFQCCVMNVRSCGQLKFHTCEYPFIWHTKWLHCCT